MASRVPKIHLREPHMNAAIYLKKAIHFQKEKNVSKAFEYFVLYFENIDNPCDSASSIQNAFTKIVCELGACLEDINNVEELLKCYLKAINLFPNNYVILNNLGGYMFRVGENDIARRYLEAAYKANTNYLPAEKNLMYLRWSQLPRSYFKTLNDKIRNMAYKEAIVDAINEGYTNVVDIGAGCGLLSLIAAQHPNVNVTAIEMNKTVYNICKDVLRENNANHVRLLNCNSTSLKTAPTPCNLLVTDIFDAGLFGENCLESLIHGLQKIVTYPKFRVIPARATMYISGISNGYLLSKYRLLNDIRVLNLEKECIKQAFKLPYDAEYLSYAHMNIRYMSPTEEVCKIDFTDIKQLTRLLNEQTYLVKLDCIETGWLHAFAIWFDLNLTDRIKITTNPNHEDFVTCWEQAIVHIEHPIYVYQNDEVILQITMKNNSFQVKIVNRQENCKKCYYVSNDVITFLNDEKLVESVIKVSEKFTDNDLTVVDMNNTPLFGFLMAKKGCTVYQVYKNRSDLEFFEHVLELNKIEKNKFIFLHDKTCLDFIEHIDVIFVDPVNLDGSLNRVVIPINENKHKNMVVLPEGVNIKTQLIHSCYLDFANKVMDESTLNFKIGKFVNKYSGTEHTNIDYITFVPLSNIFTFRIEGDFYEKSISIPVKFDGALNGIYYWYEIIFYKDVSYVTSQSCHYKKSCAFLENPKKLKVGDVVKVCVKREDSFLKVYCK